MIQDMAAVMMSVSRHLISCLQRWMVLIHLREYSFWQQLTDRKYLIRLYLDQVVSTEELPLTDLIRREELRLLRYILRMCLWTIQLILMRLQWQQAVLLVQTLPISLMKLLLRQLRMEETLLPRRTFLVLLIQL